MRTIIAGSRGCDSYEMVEEAIARSGFAPTQVISGTANGADRLGERWAESNGIPIQRCPAEWSAYGKKAGIMRNLMMATIADALIAVWDGESKGTGHMIKTAKKAGLKVYVYWF